MATITRVSNIFNQNVVSYKYTLVPNNMVYQNCKIKLSGAWQAYPSSENAYVIYGDNQVKYNKYVYGLPITGTGNDTDTAEFQLDGSFEVLFSKAVQDLDSAKYYDLYIEVTDVTILSRSKRDRWATLVSFGDNSSADYKDQFWIYAYTCINLAYDTKHSDVSYTIDGPYAIGVEANINIQVREHSTDWSGTRITSGKLGYPFLDMDVTYDIESNANVSGGAYSESMYIKHGCDDVLVCSDTYLNPIYAINPPVSTLSVNLPFRLCNGTTTEVGDDSQRCSAMSVFNLNDSTQPLVTWTGSRCGTSLKGDGLPIGYIWVYTGSRWKRVRYFWRYENGQWVKRTPFYVYRNNRWVRCDEVGLL